MDGGVPGFPYRKGIIPQSYDYFGSAAKSFCCPLFIFTLYSFLNRPSPLVTDSPPEKIYSHPIRVCSLRALLIVSCEECGGMELGPIHDVKPSIKAEDTAVGIFAACRAVLR